MPSTAQTASFEAGIKLGALYHQFVGTPVSVNSVPALETAIEESISNQPYCENVWVDIDTGRIESDSGRFGYTELAGSHLTVTVDVDYEGVSARARLAIDDGYPLMRLESVESEVDI
jgi:hypothetical protein